MAKRSRFQAPRALSDFPGVLRALREVQESLDSISSSRAELRMNLRSFNLVAGNFQRASAPAAGMQARLPKASGENLGDAVTLHLEGMLGQLEVFAAPGDTVNGLDLASYTDDGVVVLWSNGVNAWSSVAQLPSNSPAAPVLDAEYVLGAAHVGLPNGRVATDTAEIDAVLTTPNAVGWALNVASVAFSKLANLAGLSVLGRASNSTGAMAAITATAGRQVLQVNDGGTAVQWGFPVELQNNASADQGNFHTLRAANGTNTTAAVTLGVGVANIAWGVDDFPLTGLADQAADTFLGNFTAGVSTPTARAGASVAGGGLTYTSGGTLAVGSGTKITVNANDVAWTGFDFRNAAGTLLGSTVQELQPQSSTSVISSSSVVGSSASFSFQRAALTGFAVAGQDVNATTSAEPIVTYSASANMSAERVLSAGDSTVIDVATANQIQVDYVGNTAEILSNAPTGNLGTINIAALTCGGTLRYTNAASSFSIEGFTAKPVGFWFHFFWDEALTTDALTLFYQDATATAANRLTMPRRTDLVTYSPISGIFIYGADSCWHWIGDDPHTIGTNSGNFITSDVNGITAITASTPITMTAGGTADVSITAGDDVIIVCDRLTINAQEPVLTIATLSSIQSVGGVAGSTATLTAVTGTALANRWSVGTTYKFEAMGSFTRGATLTALNITFSINLNGISYASTAVAAFITTGTGAFHVVGYLTCLSTGGSGTFVANFIVPNEAETLSVAPTNAQVYDANSASANTAALGTTQSTTVNQTLALTAAMSAAVANTTIRFTNAVISKMG